jgi:YD repeat-containing protein
VLAAPIVVQASPIGESLPQTKNQTEQLYADAPVASQPVPVHYKPVNTPPEIPLTVQGQPLTMTIAYTYDPLYRMKQASYSDGTVLKYTYDAVGNRLTEELTGGIVNSYIYDAANRLTSVDGIAYTWDANGNLLSDGARSYTYDAANRLIGLNGVGLAVSYSYNGLGDRLSETANELTTQYTMDLNAGLTQVLQDGTNTYLYGVSRIAQYDASSPQYFLGDALGSVRQLVD